MLEPLLRRFADPALAASIVGDLQQEYARRAAGGRIRAVAWLWRSALAIAFLFLGRRVALAVRSALRQLRPGMLGTDLRRTIRATRRSPWFAAGVIGVMALTLAMAITAFAIVDGVLFKPIGLPSADRLWVIEPGFHDAPTPAGRVESASPRDLAAWAAALPDAGLTGYRAQPFGGYGEGVNDDAAGVASVLPNFFDVAGVSPMIGRFDPADFEARQPFVPVIATYDVWQRRFGGDPGVIGRRFEVEHAQHMGYRIVGVMPRGFTFPSDRTRVQFITPIVIEADDRNGLGPGIRNIHAVLMRLPASLSSADARAAIERAMTGLAVTLPPQGPKPEGWSDRGWRRQGPFDMAALRPLTEWLGSASRPLLAAVFAAVTLVVVLGALNVSSLMAARVLDRTREIGVRRALGASAIAVARLLWLEALVLVGLGALAGLALSPAVLQLALALLPDEIVLLKPPAIDLRVIGFALIAAAGLALLVSAWPIRRAVRLPASAGGDAGRTTDRARTPARVIVIGAQVAGAFVLTIVGALLVSSVLAVYIDAPPIDTSGVVAIECFFQGQVATMAKSPERAARVEQMLARVREVPGVRLAAVTSAQVLRGGSWLPWFVPPKDAPSPLAGIDRQPVTSEYFRLLQPQLVAGRWLTEEELSSNAPLLVVSESVARKYWKDGQAEGKLLDEYGGGEPYRVVGVVKDVNWFSWDETVGSIYGPYARLAREPMITVLMRVTGPPSAAIDAGLRAITTADPLAVPQRAARLDDFFAESVRGRRFRAWLFGSFAAVALIVVGAGIFGTLAMATARRTRELGIRQALGATRAGVVGLLTREQMGPVGAGLAIGGLAASWAVGLIKSDLYRVTPGDPRVWAVAAMVIALTAALGICVPASRASRTDPVQALRVD